MTVSGLRVNRLDMYGEVCNLHLCFSHVVNCNHSYTNLALVGSVKLNVLFKQQYKPFKGVKYITKAGKFQVRT